MLVGGDAVHYYQLRQGCLRHVCGLTSTDSIGHRGTCPPPLYKWLGTGCTMSRTVNKKLNNRVTTCLENLEHPKMSGNLKPVREFANSQGIVRE